MKWQKLMKWKKLINWETDYIFIIWIFCLLFVIAHRVKADLIVNIMMSIVVGITILYLLWMGLIICVSIYGWSTFNTNPVTDISRYQEALNDGSHTKHFPEEIPADATDVIFYYSPGFLQGGSRIQLRMKLPPERIEEIQTLFRKNAKLKYISGSKNNSPKHETSPWGTTVLHAYCFYTGDTFKYDFPENYEILVLEDTRCAPNYKYSRGVWYGIAIDISKSEVAYWAEIEGG